MRVIPWSSIQERANLSSASFLFDRDTAVTIGGFDGPHLGHATLFAAVMNAARAENLSPVAVTFTASPARFKKKESYPGDVATLDLRLSYFEEKGFEHVVLIDFSADFGKISGGVFLDLLVAQVRMKALAVGHDFRCGYRLDTGFAEIEAMSKRCGFHFFTLDPVESAGRRISSSAIREAISSGDLPLAERLLGHPFALDYRAVPWRSVGSSLIADRKDFSQIIPPAGRYRVRLGGRKGEGSASADLYIDDGTLRIDFLDGESAARIDSLRVISFRLS